MIRINLSLQNFLLAKKFTIMLLLIFISGVTISGVVLAGMLNYTAQDEISSKALMLMETMNSVRYYTNTQVKPKLSEQLATQFLPQTVPAYSAREVFDQLRTDKNYSNFFYKEATLNPSNLRDQADSFEANIVDDFRQNSSQKQVTGALPLGW